MSDRSVTWHIGNIGIRSGQIALPTSFWRVEKVNGDQLGVKHTNYSFRFNGDVRFKKASECRKATFWECLRFGLWFR